MDFTFGNVMSKGFSVYADNFARFTLLAAITYIPLVLFFALVLNDVLPLDDGSLIIAAVVATVLDLVITASVIHATFQTMVSRPVSLGESVATGLKRALPIIGTALLAGLIIGLGTLALIIPGVVAGCILWVAVPATVVERSGVVDSLSRSAKLTEGYRWPVFGIILLLGAMAGFPNVLLEGMLHDGAIGLNGYLWASLLVAVVAGALRATVAAVGYFELRKAKEGVGMDALAMAFD